MEEKVTNISLTSEPKYKTIELNPHEELPDGAESLNWKVRTEVEKQLNNVPTILKSMDDRLEILKPVPELIKTLYLKIDLNEKSNEKNQERMIVASERMSESSSTVANGVTAIVEQGKRSNDLSEKLLGAIADAFKQQDKNESRSVDIDKRADEKVSNHTFERSQANNRLLTFALVITVLMFAAFITGISLKGSIPGWGSAEISKADKKEIVQETAKQVDDDVVSNKAEISRLKRELAEVKTSVPN